MLCFQKSSIIALFYGFAPKAARNDFRHHFPAIDLAQQVGLGKEEQ
jgi:hypothetical protein